MASKMGNLKQYQVRELVTSTEFNNICAEMSGGPFIGHDVSTGNRKDVDLGDPSSGTVGHVIEDIYQRDGKKIKVIDSTGKIIKVVDIGATVEEQFGILAGKSKTSGFPDFLSPGGGTNNYFTILGAATKLEMIIDGTAYDLEADVQSNVLGLAPAANNTCLVNDPYIGGDPVWSKTIGEHGYYIKIGTVGAEITALDGTIQCFKINNGVDDEVFIAEIDLTNNRLVPVLRGIGGSARIGFDTNDTITLLKGHYIFLDDNLTTVDTTINYPKWQYTAPSIPSTGDYWFKTSERVWYRYSGASWEKLGRIYLGYGICDSVGCLWVEHEDYNLIWNNLLNINEIRKLDASNIRLEGMLRVSVAGQKIQILEKDFHYDNDLAPGESAANNSWYYLYVTNEGQIYTSLTCPRPNRNKQGYYHPSEYWRCISCFYYTTVIVAFTQNIQNNVISYNDSLWQYQLLTQSSLRYIRVPPIVRRFRWEVIRESLGGRSQLIFTDYNLQQIGAQSLVDFTEAAGTSYCTRFWGEYLLLRNSVAYVVDSGFHASSVFKIHDLFIKF